MATADHQFAMVGMQASWDKHTRLIRRLALPEQIVDKSLQQTVILTQAIDIGTIALLYVFERGFCLVNLSVLSFLDVSSVGKPHTTQGGICETTGRS